jgi:oligopeptide transport system substrate-binding protein
MSMSAEPAQEQAAYEAGELDMVATPSEDILRVKADAVLGAKSSKSRPSRSPTTATTTAPIRRAKARSRCQDPKACPTNNKNFRIALTQAVDKQAFIDATFAGIGQVANSFVMPGIPGYDESINPYPYDPDAAKASMETALAELGFSSAAEIPPLKFGFNTGAGHEPRVAFLAEAWRTTFGLETEQIGSDFSVFLTQRTAGEYDLRNGWGADYPHANNQLNGLFNCGGGNNDSQYCNPAFDAPREGGGGTGPGSQEDLYKQAQTIMMDDARSFRCAMG